jgi:SAM-dependent methyltransferase
VKLKQVYAAIYKPFFNKFRSERLRRMCEVCRVSENSRVLDVGGSYYTFWAYSPIKPQVTLLNPKASWLHCSQPGFSTMIGDGRALPFENQSFDIVVSNSVIEHLGEWHQQKIFADEIRRVGRSYWVLTPSRTATLSRSTYPFPPQEIQKAVSSSFYSMGTHSSPHTKTSRRNGR